MRQEPTLLELFQMVNKSLALPKQPAGTRRVITTDVCNKCGKRHLKEVARCGAPCVNCGRATAGRNRLCGRCMYEIYQKPKKLPKKCISCGTEFFSRKKRCDKCHGGR